MKTLLTKPLFIYWDQTTGNRDEEYDHTTNPSFKQKIDYTTNPKCE